MATTLEQETQMKNADWYYDKLSGDLQQYLKGAKSYHSAIVMLTCLEPQSIRELVTKYVPPDTQTQVFSEILRKASGKPRCV